MSNKNPKHKKKTSWELQQEKLKAEKDSKLKKLLEQEKPIYKKKTFDEKLAEKKAQESTKTIQKDNTNVRNYNNSDKFSKEARNLTKSEREEKQKYEDEQIAKERKAIREKSDANVLNQWSLDAFKPSNYTRENFAEMAKGLESRYRVSDKPNFFDDYLNPANMIGGMASNLGQAPLQAQQSDSYMPYVTSIGTPLVTGALAGLGTQNTGQFVNNLANPLAGTGDLVNNLGNRYLSNTYKHNPLAFKPQTGKIYRQVGKPGFDDAIREGKIYDKGQKQFLENNPDIDYLYQYNDFINTKGFDLRKPSPAPFFAKDDLFFPLNRKSTGKGNKKTAFSDAEYLFEGTVPDEALLPRYRDSYLTPEQNSKTFVLRPEYNDLSNFKVYERDWLQGYKQVDNNVSNPLIPLYRSVQGQEEPKNFALGGNLGDPEKQTRLNYENELMSKVLTQRNKDKNWVQRGLNPEFYPTLTDKNGNTVTHQLGYTTDDNGNAYIRPNVIQKSEGSGLSWLNNSEANKYAKETNTNMKIPDIELAEYYSQNGLIKHAMGGDLNNTNNNNMLNEFNEGGTHEQNPLGGVPQGMGDNGQMNTVEQGETKKDSFIYSNRIVLTPQVIAQFNLPKSLSGKTVADATKLINNKFEGRNSKIDNNTKKAFLDRIAEAQETVKAEEQAKIQESMQINSTEVPDMMNGQIPPGMEEYIQPQQQMFNGGELSNGLSMLGASGAMGQHTGINQATTALDLGNTAFGSTGIDTSGATDVDPGSIKPGMMGVTGALKGAQAGAMFGPLGAGIGAAVGLGAGLIGGSRAKKDALKAHQNFEIGQSNNKISNFKYGGNMYAGGGPFDKSTASYDPTKISLGLPQQQSNQFLDNLNYVKNINSQDLTTLSPEQLQENNGYSNPVVNARTFGPQGGHSTQSQIKNITDKVGTSLNKTGQFIKDNRGVLRYAPVAMNAYQLHKLNKEGYDTVNPIINNTRYNPQYMDEKVLTNQINAETNYTANALANASNGSLGSLSNNILGMQLNKTKALSDAYSKVADVNRNEDKIAQEFNLRIDDANIGRRVGAEDRTAMNKGSFKTEQSKLRGQIGTDLGEIGKEETYKEMAKKLYNYDFNGKYYIAPDGTKMTTQEMANKIDEDRNIQQQKKAQIGTTVLKGFNNKTK